MKYKLLRRKNPQDKEAPAKWYATPMNNSPESVKRMTAAATKNTTTAPIELESALTIFGDYAAERLIAGDSIRLGDLGILRMTFHSDGVEDINDFNPLQMIHDLRLSFVASDSFREQYIRQITFENAGVLEDGINYASLADYRVKKGLEAPGFTGILCGATGATNGHLKRGAIAFANGGGILCKDATGEGLGKGYLRNEFDVDEELEIKSSTDDTLIFVVPIDLAEGNYTLRIETYIGTNGKLQTEPRTIEYPTPLVLE